jgi:hypothetical protein
MRKPFLRGTTSTRDPERRRLWMAPGGIPQPIPGPWTLQAVIQPDEAHAAADAKRGAKGQPA